MLASVVFRNIFRSRRRLAPLIVALILTFAGLMVGNGILTSSNESLYGTYASHISGDMSVSAAEAANFTIFGSDALLVGEYQVPPTLLNFEELQNKVDDLPQVRASVPAITAVARVEINGRRSEHTVIGVDFDRYRETFEDLEITAGEFPESGERAVLVQEEWGEDAIGEGAVLSAAFDSSFAVREAPVRGVFRFPISGEQLDRVIITDPVTARGLNGYVAGTAGGGEIPEAEREALDADLDSLFGAGESDDSGEVDEGSGDQEDNPDDEGLFEERDDFGDQEDNPDEENGLFEERDDFGDQTSDQGEDESADDGLFDERDDFGDESGSGDSVDEPTEDEDRVAELEAFFRDASDRSDSQASETSTGVWNFLLLSLHDRDDVSRVQSELNAARFSENSGFLIRNWRDTVGGNAEIAWYLQLMFNVGVFFIAIGAAMVTTNALVLSVLERTGEIGTMRALGATRARVGTMITLETAVTVVGSALLGIGLGALGIGVLNASGVMVENPYIDMLFGGEAINAVVNIDLILLHVAGAVALALVAVLYPLKRALGVSPVEAMRE
ncbi:MAG: FtsX-like permease family protein [Spirochaetales bacterium]